MRIVQYAIDSFGLGSLYALAALSIALIFGLMRLINFAHGELIVLAGYAMWYLATVQRLSWPLVLLGILGSVAAAAVVMERMAFRPFRSAGPETLLVSSFAISFVLQSVFFIVFGADTHSVAVPKIFAGLITEGSLRLSKVTVLTLSINLTIMGLLALFLRKTSLGLQMLAAAEDFEMARLLGVRANRVIPVAFAISGLMAGIVAFLLVAVRGEVHPTIGLQPLLIAFVAVVLGGMGSLTGAALGGMIMGITITVLQVGLPRTALPFRDAFAFTLVIVILLIRPQGLLGTRAREVRV